MGIRIFLSGFVIMFCSCQSQTTESPFITPDDLEVTVPSLVTEIEQVEEYYFDHLNYKTVALDNGDIILNDRGGGFILQITPDGELVRRIARKGRGPGELQDATELNTDIDGNLVTFDQMNQKIVLYPAGGSKPEEFMPQMSDEYRILSVHATGQQGTFLINHYRSAAFVNEDIDDVTRMAFYDRNSDEFPEAHSYPDREMAPLFLDGRIVGATRVPFAPAFYYGFPQDKETLYVTWTEHNEIAEIDILFDTLRTIPVPVEREVLSGAEIDSLENEYRPEQWQTVEERLPERKMSFDGMIVDHKNRFWLKLTRVSDHQEWLILDPEGNPLKLVLLPKAGMLTHISEHHLGFRADDHLFTLYEPVE